MTLREIKRRIKSIEGTEKITKAMSFVATVKSQKMHAEFANAKHFFLDMEKFLEFMSCDEYNLSKEKKCLIFITSNKGLCGGYNINIGKLSKDVLSKIKAEKIIGIGNNSLAIAKKNNIELDKFFLNRKFNIDLAEEVGDLIIDLYKNNYEVCFVYTKFYSSIKFLPVYKKILPLKKNKREILFEPSKTLVVDSCIKKFVKYIAYEIILESELCLQNARMISMQSATDNAEDILKKLRLKYNMIRQSKITQELIEIISGANSLKN